MREVKDIYCFIQNENKQFMRAVLQPDGSYTVTPQSAICPIDTTPSNLLKQGVEFGTNRTYLTPARSINYSLDFIKDGGAILKELFYNGKGTEENAYLTIVEWNGSKHVLSYYGKFDFLKKKDLPEKDTFSVPCIDDSAWGVLKDRADIDFSIECNQKNPAAIPVLIHGISLVNKYNFQIVAGDYSGNTSGTQLFIFPLALINESGDSYGAAARNQEQRTIPLAQIPSGPNPYDYFQVWYFYTHYAINGAIFHGTIEFIPIVVPNSSTDNLALVAFGYIGNTVAIPDMVLVDINYYTPTNHLVVGQKYSFDFSFTFNMPAETRISIYHDYSTGVQIHYNVTNIYLETKTVTEPVIAYSLRALDLGKQLVNKATFGRFGINSNELSINNKTVLTGGDSIRGFKNAKIFSSFNSYFKSLECAKFLAIRDILGSLWIEKADDVYDPTTGTIIDLGEAIDIDFDPAEEFIANEIEVGSPKIDYRHPSGRLEAISRTKFSLEIKNSTKKIDWVSKYRFDPMGIAFLILDYLQGTDTRDNEGDNTVFGMEITDTMGAAAVNVSNFEEITVDNALLEPIIMVPLNNEQLYYELPVISGRCVPLSNVNVYVDSELDGNTIADAAGNWSYQLVNALSVYDPLINETGVHVIEASYTDLLDPKSSVTVTVDTTVPLSIILQYPKNLDDSYDNLPLVRGVTQYIPSGTNTVTIKLGGVSIATVAIDTSGRFEYQFVAPLVVNSSNTIEAIDNNSANIASATFNLIDYPIYPIITYIDGRPVDEFPLVNNLPVIYGWAKPGQVVNLYIDYISYTTLATAFANGDGNWSVSLSLTTYVDPLSLHNVTIAPLKNGLSIISTDLLIRSFKVNIYGYTLDTSTFNVISGVTDNTYFNLAHTPKRWIMQHKSWLAAMLQQNQSSLIHYQLSDKNGNLISIEALTAFLTQENSDITFAELGSPFAIFEWGNMKIKALKSFANTLYNFNNGGLIVVRFRGNPVFFLPIGTMKMDSIRSSIQDWKLLLAPNNAFSTLLSLSRKGITINLMSKSVYHSDGNTLHIVKYGYQRPDKFNTSGIYNDWFKDRNEFWALNPGYIQKLQRTEVIKDQIITKDVEFPALLMYTCRDAILIDRKVYAPVNPAPIPTPDIVYEVAYDLANYSEDQYFFVLDGVVPRPFNVALYGQDINITGDVNTGFVILNGTPTTGEHVVVVVFYGGGGTPNNITLTSVVLAGWTITDVYNDLIAQVAGITNPHNAGAAISPTLYDGNLVLNILSTTGGVLPSAKITNTNIEVTNIQNFNHVNQFVVTGTPAVNDVIKIVYNTTFGTFTYATIFQQGWTISTAIANLLAQISTNVNFVSVTSPFANEIRTDVGAGNNSSYTSYLKRNESIGISERVETRDRWAKTILIEGYNSVNSVGMFYSSGIKTVIRVEGLVGKLQPNIEANVAVDDIMNSQLLSAITGKGRMIRFGSAYGLPDYLYNKIVDALSLDFLQIEGINYVLEKSEKVEQSDAIPGHPLFHYQVKMLLAVNERGAHFLSNSNEVTINVDGTVFGQAAGTNIQINIE